jgi:hypothetical protein
MDAAIAAAKVHFETKRIIPAPAVFPPQKAQAPLVFGHKPFMVQTIRQAIDVALVFV